MEGEDGKDGKEEKKGMREKRDEGREGGREELPRIVEVFNRRTSRGAFKFALLPSLRRGGGGKRQRAATTKRISGRGGGRGGRRGGEDVVDHGYLRRALEREPASEGRSE